MVRNCDAPEPEPDPEAFGGLAEGDFDEPTADYDAPMEVAEINADTAAGICVACGSIQDVIDRLCGHCAGTRDTGGES